jgi:DNA 3'-phosphatase
MNVRHTCAALLALAVGSVAAGCESDPGAETNDATSCEGAYEDDAGRCRKAGGRFAKKICCEPQAPQARRSLDTYACPSGGDSIPVAFFDADSTLRISRAGAVTATAVDDVYALPLAAGKIRELNQQGMLVAVVSNQGGVAAGHETLEVAEGALVFLTKQLFALGAKVDYFDLAEAYDGFRKPKIGMATKLDELLLAKCGAGIDFDASFMVGDSGYKKNVDGPHPDGRPADDFSNADRFFAQNAGIPFHEPTDYFDWRAFEIYNIHKVADITALYAAMEAEAQRLDESGEDDARAEMLRDEVEANRAINGL